MISCQLAGNPSYVKIDDNTVYDRLGTISPEAIVFPKAILRKDENFSLMLSSKPRYVTLTLDILPVTLLKLPQLLLLVNMQDSQAVVVLHTL